MNNYIIILLISCLSLCGCNQTLQKLKNIGKPPQFNKMSVPNLEEYNSDATHMTKATMDQIQSTNSLWQDGSIQFFRDNRAWRVGDILKIIVEINDRARVNSTTKQKRNSKDGFGMPKFFGKAEKIAHALSKDADPANLLDVSGKGDHLGQGSIIRDENVKIELAAMVTRVLPNGNLIVSAEQEIRINNELRRIELVGIVRPKDITAQNSINFSQVANGKMSYGGSGVVSNTQEPRVGYQVLDIISPF
ncbi:MAG: flagellar basal body L-ring protein FlgH [Rickettsiaceae bacterium]